MSENDNSPSGNTSPVKGNDALSSLGSRRRGSWLKGLYTSFTDNTESDRVFQQNKTTGDGDAKVYDVNDVLFIDSERALELYGKRRQRTLSEPYIINATNFARESVPTEGNAHNEGLAQLPGMDNSNISASAGSSPNETAFESKTVINRRGSLPFFSSFLTPKQDTFSNENTTSADSAGNIKYVNSDPDLQKLNNEGVATMVDQSGIHVPMQKRERSRSLLSSFYKTNDRFAPPIETHKEEDPDGLDTGEFMHFLSTAGRGF